MAGILRVLKPSGLAILRFQIHLESLETLEDDTFTRDERRTQYGLPDCVRYYAENDCVSRLTPTRFNVTIRDYASSLDATRN